MRKRTRRAVGLLAVLAVLAVGACSPSDADLAGREAAASRPREIAPTPVAVRLKQRTTEELPSSGGRYRITIGDVTRGRVDVSLLRAGGEPILGPVAMRLRSVERFVAGGHVYAIELTELHDALVGDDHATFELREAQDVPSESELIDALLLRVETLAGAKFLRNGAEHGPAEAAAHLRSKRDSASRDVATADAFIAAVASRSSLTGAPYLVRFEDGRTVALADLLADELARLRRSKVDR